MARDYINRMRTTAALLLLTMAGCATATRSPIDLTNARLVDLTHSFNEDTLYWPNAPGTFALKRDAHGMTPGGYFYSSNSFCSPEHGGTHLDAPIHFSARGRSVDRIPLHQLIAPAAIIDVIEKTIRNHDYRLTADDVREWESRNGLIEPGTIVLLRTGWARLYPNRKVYFGDDTPGATDSLHFPSYGESAARLLVDERQVAALGVDTASIDYGQSKDFIVHQIANGLNVPGLENLGNMEGLPERLWIIALPMKIEKGSGGPVRVVAVVPR